MFITSEIFGEAATIVAALGFALYIVSILKGKNGSKPSRMTWFILATIASMIAYGNWMVGADATFPALLINAIGSVVVACLAIKYGDSGWEPVDQLALVGVIATCIIWVTTQNNLIGLLCALSVDLIAIWPTVLKVRKKPWLEESAPWIVTVSACLLNVLALNIASLSSWNWETAISPVYLFFINAFVLYYILRPRHQHKPVPHLRRAAQ